MKKLQILIGFFVSIPVIIILIGFYFLKSCLDKYEGWLIDLKAKAEK